LTASPIHFPPGAFTAPVVDYEPQPFDAASPPAPELNVAGPPAPELNVADPPAACPAPTPASLHRPSRRPMRPTEPAPHLAPPPAAATFAPPPAAPHLAPPPAAATFADIALRRVLEVIDRRRPIAQLRPLLTPALLDMVFTLTRGDGPDKAAVLRRVRLRTASVDEREPHGAMAAEVFATYTRGRRVRAIAGRIEAREGRWRMVALQVG
jgi:hypothetical protein